MSQYVSSDSSDSFSSKTTLSTELSIAPNKGDTAAMAAAVDYLVAHADAAPTLAQAADASGLSPSHFQRVFKSSVGISPKKFLQYLAAGRAKRAIAAGETVLGASIDAGLSGPSRLHDLFIVSEAMTPGAYRARGDGLVIRYARAYGPFGEALIGATDKGVCWLSFLGETQYEDAVAEMQADWKAAQFFEDAVAIHPIAERAFDIAMKKNAKGAPLALHLRGTNFQLKVWEALLAIPRGEVATYADVASAIGAPKASRAVGAAVGANLVSLLIPCHRVILASGALHNYRWGASRKRGLLAIENALEPSDPGAPAGQASLRL